MKPPSTLLQRARFLGQEIPEQLGHLALVIKYSVRVGDSAREKFRSGRDARRQPPLTIVLFGQHYCPRTRYQQRD